MTESKRIHLRNGKILDLGRGRLISGQEVVIEGERIVQVRPQAVGNVPEAASQGMTVLDLAGRTLMPGLIDCHVHVLASSANLGDRKSVV